MEKEITETTQEKGNIKISRGYLLIAGIVVIALIAGFLAYKNYDFLSPGTSEVAATVNGQVITMDELEKAYASVSQQYGPSVTKEQVLEQLVQAKVIYDKAVEEGVAVSDEDVKAQLEAQKQSAGITDEQFNSKLEAQGMTEDEFVKEYGKQLTVQKFLDENLLNNIQVSEDEIKTYYDANPDKFKKEESVVVRHILIGDEGLSDAEKKEKANKVLKEVTQDNFCDKVKEYTTDTASAETCGEYAFTRNDPLVPEFIDLSFKQKKGEIGIVKTQFGYHIIWTVDKMPAHTVSLEEAHDQIADLLKNQKAKQQYDSFYQNLAADQDIELKFEAA